VDRDGLRPDLSFIDEAGGPNHLGIIWQDLSMLDRPDYAAVQDGDRIVGRLSLAWSCPR
jgi:hypothetical protein